MLSIFKQKRHDHHPDYLQEQAENAWDIDNLRRVAAPPEKRNYWPKVRSAAVMVLALLILMGAASLLQRHLPAIVNFAVGLRSSVSELRENVKKYVATMARPARQARKIVAADRPKMSHKHAAALQNASSSTQFQFDDALPGPFWAVAIVGDRETRVTAKNKNVLVDIPTGDWTWVPETE